jgi:hypothetical protein
VRNKWLRLLETLGRSGASMTGAPAQQAAPAEARSGNHQQPGGSQSGSSSRGRGRGGFQNRGGNSRGGRGGSRVVPRPVIPPAAVSTPSILNCGTGPLRYINNSWIAVPARFHLIHGSPHLAVSLFYVIEVLVRFHFVHGSAYKAVRSQSIHGSPYLAIALFYLILKF